MKSRTMSTKELVMLAMISAIAYAMVCVCRIPLGFADFLKYEPKDVIITIGGFLFGPLAVVGVSLVVSLVEMVTISTTGPIGMIMNVLSTCAFSCTAALIYKKKHTLKGAILGLSMGVVLTTIVMILWNYLITPLYQGVPREAIVQMLIPVYLPFNLLKGTINAGIILLIYKPIVTNLRKLGLLSKNEVAAAPQRKLRLEVVLLALLLLVSCTLFVLAHQGII